MHTYNTLTIAGYEGKSVPNTFMRQRDTTSHAAIILPGFGYTAQMPLLFYTGNHLLSLGADILQVNYNYLTAFRTLDRATQHRWLFADADAAYRALREQRPYTRITVVGKSLGTLAMAHLFATRPLPPRADALWLTPVLRDAAMRAQIAAFDGPSLLIIGTADPFYDAGVLAEIAATPTCTVVTVEGADHGLNIGNDVLQSIHALETTMRAITAFFDHE